MTRDRHKPVIGLVGAVGAGKTLAAQLFMEQGCAVIDADELARQALEEPDVRRQIEQHWGPQVLGEAGLIDRDALASRVFDDKQALDDLEQIIHPRVHAARQRLRRQHDSDDRVRAIIEDCPLLLEKHLEDQCDHLVFVDAPRSLRVRRVRQNRGWSEQNLADREKNQMGVDFKARRADYVVVNDADPQHLASQVRSVLFQILQG